MRGYIREYRPGKFSYTCYVGKDENGKNKKIERGGFTSKKDCEAALNKKLVELVDTGTIFIPSEKTFEEVYQEYREYMKYSWSASTYKIKSTCYDLHIKNDIGYRYIKSIKSSDINKILSDMLDKGYKAETVNNVKKVLSGTCHFALDRQYIKLNPCEKTIVAKKLKRNIEVFTPAEIKTILEITKHSNLYSTIFIPLYTGMRIGEVMGLRWQDVDLEHKTIDINHQLIMERGRKCISEPKHHSDRAIHIPQILVDFLTELKVKQEQNKKIAAELYHTSNRVYSYFSNQYEDINDFLCVKEDGQLMHRSSTAWITRKCAKYNIAFHPHKLRHTYATTLLEAGCSIKLLQETLGHKSAMFTLDIYSHVTKQHEQDIIEKLPAY